MASGAFRGSTPPPKIGLPSFALTDGDRESPVRASDLEGKAVALTFLDSECTDVCPLMAPTMAAALD
ncbi:MAG: SCO family protein, partial [Gaiellaceae bacterium]